jgi:hypothetical protein
MSRDSRIPREFRSSYLGRPFETCLCCQCELLQPGRLYTVQKAYVARECVFELAVCLDCAEDLAASYSQESRAAIDDWVGQRLGSQKSDPAADPDRPNAGGPATDTPSDRHGLDEPGTDVCRFCHRERAASHRFLIAAWFEGPNLIELPSQPPRIPAFPLLMCDQCSREGVDRLSKKTRETWDRFIDEHFDGPPGIELDPADRDLLFV